MRGDKGAVMEVAFRLKQEGGQLIKVRFLENLGPCCELKAGRVLDTWT